MKARITKEGILQVKRAGKWLDQQCPDICTPAGRIRCSHNCPLFTESDDVGVPIIALACGRWGKMDLVEDLRERPEKEEADA